MDMINLYIRSQEREFILSFLGWLQGGSGEMAIVAYSGYNPRDLDDDELSQLVDDYLGGRE